MNSTMSCNINDNDIQQFAVTQKPSLLGMTVKEMQDMALSLFLPKFVGKQLAQWVYGKCAHSFDDMTNISLKNRQLLGENLTMGTAEPLQTLVSVDGTEKYLFPTCSGQFIETVYIPDKDRGTLCVSTQVGCKMNCLFCQTGKQGFHGNLTATDILAQVQWAIREKGITNIVFMGQGEPFDNLDNVMRAIELLTAEDAFAWSPKRITVSTVGLRKNLRRFLEKSQCHLAVSLHSPIHEQRLQLMPAEKQFEADDIIQLLRQYDFAHQRRLSFEYIVFKGLNDSKLHADALLKLLRGLDCRVNLIRFHKIPDVGLEGTDDAHMTAFRDYLTHHGLFTTVRASRGEDIMAACGLLSTAHQTENKNG